MSVIKNSDYKSPLRKLVKFFEQSRNKWKEKYQDAKKTIKRLSNRVRYLETSKEQWKQKAIRADKELKQLKVVSEKKQEELEQIKKKLIKPIESTPLKNFEIVPFYHKYSIGHIMLCLSLVLSASSSLRGSSRSFETIVSFFQISLPVPSWYTVRLWLMRFGYYKLIRPKQYANDWIWIVDHTIQLGDDKCLIILGIRMCNLPSPGSCLKHEDVEPITLIPVKQSNGNIVYEQLEETLNNTGAPREIIGDYGSDLKAGIERFCNAHSETYYIHDIKHKTALLLKHELQADPIWNQFTNYLASTKLELQQTSFAFLSPPNKRSKSRYMNVDVLVRWGQKTLNFLEQLDPNENTFIMTKLAWLMEYRSSLCEWGEMMQVIGIVESQVRTKGYFSGCHEELKQLLSSYHSSRALKMSQKLLDFVDIQELKVKPGERLVGSSEVIESVLGKQKYLEHEQSKSGFTGLLLAIAAMIGERTTNLVSEAFEKVSTRQVISWCKMHLGQTLQAKRKAAFATKSE